MSDKIKREPKYPFDDAMKELKHTPGPWRFSPSDFEGEFIITGSNELGGSVLPILGRTHNWPHNAEANARVMAAAPELLDAAFQAKVRIESLITFIEKHIPNEDASCKREIAWSIQENLRAAIAKATGEA